MLLGHTREGELGRVFSKSRRLIMEANVEGLIGAGRHERAENRTTWRNGYRDRTLDTRLGTLNLKVPKLRHSSYFPELPRGPKCRNRRSSP